MTASLAALVQLSVLWALSARVTESTLSTLTLALIAALAQVPALSAHPRLNNYGKSVKAERLLRLVL